MATALCLSAPGFRSAANAASSASVRLDEIAEGVLVFGGVDEIMAPENHGAICNIAAVIGGECVAVIDSGGSIVEAKAFIAALEAVTDKPVRYLVNTHMHPDHIFGNAAFRKPGLTIVGHKNLPRALEARGPFYLQSYRRQLGEEMMKGIEIVLPTVTVDATMDIDLGGRTLSLRAWKAAHTDNDLTAFDARTRTFFAGDLVFLRHLPTLDGSLLGWMR
ncbi:MAG TPA: MBL fold metallo-hydrolase, partial [Mesorhizobium sp.]